MRGKEGRRGRGRKLRQSELAKVHLPLSSGLVPRLLLLYLGTDCKHRHRAPAKGAGCKRTCRGGPTPVAPPPAPPLRLPLRVPASPRLWAGPSEMDIPVVQNPSALWLPCLHKPFPPLPAPQLLPARVWHLGLHAASPSPRAASPGQGPWFECCPHFEAYRLKQLITIYLPLKAVYGLSPASVSRTPLFQRCHGQHQHSAVRKWNGRESAYGGKDIPTKEFKQ